VLVRSDQDEAAIGKRHDIYYDTKTGTMAAVNYFKKAGGAKVISVDGSAGIKDVTALILAQLS
jgi:adenylate kinase